MKKLKGFLAVALAVMMAVSLTACGGESKPTSSAKKDMSSAKSSSGAVTSETSSASKSGTGSTASVAGGEKYAIVLKTQSSQFWQDMKAGIEEEAAKLGVKVDVQSGNTEDDVEGQVQVLENFVSTGEYKAIGVAPISDVNLNNAIAEGCSKGIVFIDIDEKIDAKALGELGGGLYAYVATDNKEVGETGAGELLKQVGNNAEVAIIEGKAGALSGEQRRDGAKAAFEAAGAKLVDSQPADWDRTKAMDVATNMISANPNLKAIYCCNDTMAMGAVEAVKKSGKDIKVCGTDGNDDAIKAVADGELAATVAQNPKLVGATALNLMVKAVKENAKPEAGAEVSQTGIAAVLITKDNAKEYLK
jgi:hypothetical protein